MVVCGYMNEQIPKLNLQEIPTHLRQVAHDAQDLVRQSFSDHRHFEVPPRRIAFAGDTWSTYFELPDNPDLKGYEKLAIHLGKVGLTIAHEHRHAADHPYVTVQGAPEFETATAVLQDGEARLFQSTRGNITPGETITDRPERSESFIKRIRHALATLGIKN